MSFVTDNEKFWKVVKPLLKGKGSGVRNEIILLGNGKILRDDNEAGKELHSYFNSIVSSLDITENKYIIEKSTTSSEPIDKPIMKFQFHPSILILKSKINALNALNTNFLCLEQIKRLLKRFIESQFGYCPLT